VKNNFFEQVFVIWKREMKRYRRERGQLLSTLLLSFIWLVIFGTGIGSMGVSKFPGNYKEFLFPGIIGLVLLVISLRAGVSVIRDREFGFLRVLFATPGNRSAILLGKVFGGAMAALSQGIIVLLLSFLLEVTINAEKVFYSLLIMVLISFGIVSLGIVIAGFLESFESFNLIMSTLFMPMFFLSGAVFPVNLLPAWMQILANLNPLTYGIDALREIIIEVEVVGIAKDIVILVFFDVFIFLAAIRSFKLK